MAKSSPNLTNFTAGEWSEMMYGRVDLAKYANACRSLVNMFLHPQGGVSRRYGSHYVATTKSNGQARLIGWKFNAANAYVLEAGSSYLRFYAAEGQIASPPGSPVEVATPWSYAQVQSLRFVQDADVMYFFHPEVEPRILTRLGHYSWTLATVAWATKPPEWKGANWPSCAAFYEQRLFVGGTPNEPGDIWGSVPQIYENFATGTADSSAVHYVLAGQLDAMKWLLPARYLMLGTAAGEWVMSSGSDDLAITPTKIKVRQDEAYGSANLQALLIGKATVFLQRAGRKVRNLLYDYASDSFKSADMTLLAEHITEGTITEWAWAAEPDSILWCVRGDGSLLGLTYDQTQDVTGWHRHETDGYYESVAAIPAGTHDQVWTIVRRTIGGLTKRYVEFFEEDFGTDQDACWFVDSGLSYSGVAASKVTGLDHLEGKVVQIFADGAVDAPCTVVSASVTLSRAASSIVAGLPYTSVLETLRLESGAQDGTAQGKRKRISKVVVRLYRSLAARIGWSSGNEDTVPFRYTSDAFGSPTALFTGDKEVLFPGQWDFDGHMRIIADQPVPLTVISIMPKLMTHD